jgi:hypothetical protein
MYDRAMQKPTTPKKLRLSHETVRVLKEQLASAVGADDDPAISGRICSFVYTCIPECSAGRPLTTCNQG